MRVSILIPNWNGQEKLDRNLPDVLKVSGVDEVVVSDDASTDQSVNLLKMKFPQIKIVERKLNGGFSSNVNEGVLNTKGDLIFLLNSDARPEKDCVLKVLKNFKDERVFSVGFNTGGSFSGARFKEGFFWHFMSSQKVVEVHQTLWASGGSMIFRKDIWSLLGGFDELFNPFYEEDVDLGYRATKRGYINLWDPSSKVEHYRQKGVIAENFSREHILKVAQRNQLIFIWKNITSKKMISEHKKYLLKMILSHPKYSFIFFDALKKMSQVMEKRKVEELELKVTDEEIMQRFNE